MHVQGVVTVVALAVPAVISLLALVRLMAARTAVTAQLEEAADLAQEQTELLMNRQAPTESLPKLLASPWLNIQA